MFQHIEQTNQCKTIVIDIQRVRKAAGGDRPDIPFRRKFPGSRIVFDALDLAEASQHFHVTATATPHIQDLGVRRRLRSALDQSFQNTTARDEPPVLAFLRRHLFVDLTIHWTPTTSEPNGRSDHIQRATAYFGRDPTDIFAHDPKAQQLQPTKAKNSDHDGSKTRRVSPQDQRIDDNE